MQFFSFNSELICICEFLKMLKLKSSQIFEIMLKKFKFQLFEKLTWASLFQIELKTM